MEHIRTHMGLGVHENALRRAAGNQLLQDEAMAQILGAGVQLSVGKSPGAALAKLHIGVGKKGPTGPKIFHILLPLLHGLAPL